jgi:hypothetical protein
MNTMANTHITPEELQKAVLKWTSIAAVSFVGAVVVYVYFQILN